MESEPDLPDERTLETEDGHEFTVRETVDEAEVAATRKVQLDQYEPFTGHNELGATKPGDLDRETTDEWIMALGELATAYAERQATRRFEEYVREEAFGDD
jgi:hypothetical protein